MASEFEMRLCRDGVIRPVYTDSDGDEYVVISGERKYLDPDVEMDDEDDE